MEALWPLLYGFALVLFRTAGLVVAAPVLGAEVVPVRIRAAIALAVAVAVFIGAGSPQAQPPEALHLLAGAALVETAVGLAAGFGAWAVLQAAWAAGNLAGLGMGLGYGSLIDPFSGSSSTVLAQLLSMVALGVAAALGIHREAIAWLTRSVVAFPPGAQPDLLPLLSAAVGNAVFGATLAIRLAFPILAAVTFGHVALGLIGRTAQQLNLSSVGFSVAILAGGGALYLVAPAAAEVAAREAVRVFSRS